MTCTCQQNDCQIMHRKTFDLNQMFIHIFLFRVFSHIRTVSWEGMTSVRGLVKRKGNVQSLFQACETGGNSPYHSSGTGIERDFC